MIAILLALLAVVNTPVNSVSYACDGATAVYSVTYPYLDQAYLTVTSTTAGGVVTSLVLTTDYTLSVVSTSTAATLTLTNPATKCPVGSTLKIARKTTRTQPKSFKTQLSYLPEIHETALDRITEIVQEGVSVTAPLAGNGQDITISMPQATGSVSGFLSSVDWTTFNSKAATGTCTNQFVSAAGSGSLTCTTDVLASAQHANQGSANLTLHGNAGGNPSWSAVSLTADVSGILPEPSGGTGAGALTCPASQFLTSNGSAYSCAAVTGVSLTSGVSGILPEPNGGTGAGALTCPAGQFLTSNGTAYSCAAVAAVVADAPLTGLGTSASHLVCTVSSGSAAGCLASADWTTFSNKQAGPLTGDVTTSGAAATLASTAVTPASYGSGSTIPSFTVDAKGRLTAAASNTASLPASAISSGSFADARLTDAYSGTGACAANSWASTLNRDAAPTCTQPAFSNISGTAASGQIPNLDASKITTGTVPEARGGTGAGALTCAAGDFLTSNGTLYSCGTPNSGGTITNQHAESSVSANCPNTGSTLATLTMAAGTYAVTASVEAVPSGTAVTLEADIKKNGTIVTGGQFYLQDNGGNIFPVAAGIARTAVVTFALNDSLTLTCLDSAGTGRADGWSLVAFKLQ